MRKIVGIIFALLLVFSSSAYAKTTNQNKGVLPESIQTKLNNFFPKEEMT